MSHPIRVVIVDDSAAMRMMLQRILDADPAISVVGTAPDPYAARQMIKDLHPDVVTLDIEMPGMDGLSFLEKIMRLRPLPVVMCSTLTLRGAEATIEALKLGAVDCIEKPSGNPAEMERNADLLRWTVRHAARSTVRPTTAGAHGVIAAGNLRPDALIAVGASTGGVEALFSLVSALPEDCPPVLVVQHMPATFTASFAARLDRESRVQVVEAQHRMEVRRGTVYIAPGGERHMELSGGSSGRISLLPGDPVSGHRPSVDVLFRSVARLGSRAVGAILTGMGSDGARGLLEMRNAGARTLGQNEATCVVYGMPRAANAMGAVQNEIGLSVMPEAILSACRA